MVKKFWRDRSIGGKYAVVFSVVMLTFVVSLAITYWLLSNTSESIQETKSKNDMVIEVSELMSLYQEKYLNIPEYIIIESDDRLVDYLSLSERFVETARKLRGNIETDDQLLVFQQIIDNNHALDEYYFSEIVPNVQQINTDTFTELQANANELKNDTMELGDSLMESAVTSNTTSIEEAQNKITLTILILILSVIVSIIISTSLLFFISRNIRVNLAKVVETSDQIAKGNLNVAKLDDDSKDEIGLLSKSVNDMRASLKNIIVEVSALANSVDQQVQTISSTSDEVKEGSEQVSLTIEELATGATNQANEATSISERTQDLNSKIISLNENGEKLAIFSKDVLVVSIDGDSQMKESVEQMTKINMMVDQSVKKINHLEQQTNSISKFVTVIRSIAEQTNLLALNASIEAARAGESGKGFAVVADEVRKLAEDVTTSVESITEIVDSIKVETEEMVTTLTNGSEEVTKGTEKIETSGEFFSEIKEKVSMMVERVNDVSTSLSSFEKTSEEINYSVEQIAAISEQSAAGSEEISASVNDQQFSINQVSSGASELTQMVERMNALIQHFQIDDETSDKHDLEKSLKRKRKEDM
ncbi:methyl-accepting chemotaxis protein [Salipaludibacillus sp. HK11]|uniref:methyl-accepting chemotaxis protein n=1 Tax=Salipaludibacillus sp. HK11 TaxID=3394320 RepID=UPI0039FCC869